MTRRFGFIVGAIAGFGLMIFVSPALHAQTMGEYGGVTGGQMATGGGQMASGGSQWNSMSAGIDTKLGGAATSMSHGSQPVGSAHTIEIPGDSATYHAKTERAARSDASDDPSTHNWVRVR